MTARKRHRPRYVVLDGLNLTSRVLGDYETPVEAHRACEAARVEHPKASMRVGSQDKHGRWRFL